MLSEEQQTYMVSKFLVPTTIFNFILNGGIGYLTFYGSSSIPLWGNPSVAADTVGTTFFLPFITFLIIARIVSGHRTSGQVASWPEAQQRFQLLRKWPVGSLLGACLLSLACLGSVGPIALALLYLVGPPVYSVGGAVLVKATYSTLLSLLVVPAIVALALREQRHAQRV